jgi:hypothetical protein
VGIKSTMSTLSYWPRAPCRCQALDFFLADFFDQIAACPLADDEPARCDHGCTGVLARLCRYPAY